MKPDQLTPQPLSLEGFLAWAKEAGHYPAIQLLNNFIKFQKECPKPREK
jgi:hypothetical protein